MLYHRFTLSDWDVERVMKAAVIGVPDALRGEVLEAFVVLRADDRGDEALAAELQRLVKQQFAAHAYPRTVHFVNELPKTPSGKVQRFVLRRRRRMQVFSDPASGGPTNEPPGGAGIEPGLGDQVSFLEGLDTRFWPSLQT
ncbi:AMP-binding enzyme [Deinococcus humi]|uniref:Acyl-CoA synthetase (AMP-forming)/AMP-acid ligase II n=1 Tax=Deinococcus humi TaxID=662880 RepID=A0A7W8JUQ4_9DEIO|nr:hypothetical protein [Deinococcus humi]MBB5363514.1 acyl-CoA synthetase (AMP-forming)/AMP-acid ligase II [Deinococcus humi]GGO30423.1 hypothetical protein GCM10008949_25280 [Deinococcus humi]